MLTHKPAPPLNDPSRPSLRTPFKFCRDLPPARLSQREDCSRPTRRVTAIRVQPTLATVTAVTRVWAANCAHGLAGRGMGSKLQVWLPSQLQAVISLKCGFPAIGFKSGFHHTADCSRHWDTFQGLSLRVQEGIERIPLSESLSVGTCATGRPARTLAVARARANACSDYCSHNQ